MITRKCRSDDETIHSKLAKCDKAFVGKGEISRIVNIASGSEQTKAYNQFNIKAANECFIASV